MGPGYSREGDPLAPTGGACPTTPPPPVRTERLTRRVLHPAITPGSPLPLPAAAKPWPTSRPPRESLGLLPPAALVRAAMTARGWCRPGHSQPAVVTACGTCQRPRRAAGPGAGPTGGRRVLCGGWRRARRRHPLASRLRGGSWLAAPAGGGRVFSAAGRPAWRPASQAES